MKTVKLFKSFLVIVALLFVSNESFALDLDWSGQFRMESHWILNYTMDRANLVVDTTKESAGGYYVPAGGKKDATMQTLFMRLNPSLIVNDNVSIKSEWWLGDPIFGFYGNASPYPADQRKFYSSQSRGSVITAQRFWAEILSNFGTLQIGRAPLHWGLGLFWNNGGGLFDRYASTGDMIRMVSKFGSFTFAPGFIKYSQGNSFGGNCLNPTAASPGQCNSTSLGGSVSDYSIAMLYDSIEEELQIGLNFIRRLGDSGQDPTSGYLVYTGAPGGFAYNVWDFYASKRFGDLELKTEIPIVSGSISGTNYSAFSAALEANWSISKSWAAGLKTGYASGQSNISTATPGTFKAFNFNPNYNIAMIMFNYQPRSFSGPTTLNNNGTSQLSMRSPFDNPITNALYIATDGSYRVDKWEFRLNWAYAQALNVAAPGANFYNSWDNQFYAFGGSAAQSKSIGWEIDWGTTFFWDDAIRFDFDFGWYFPGSFFRFSNTANENNVSNVFGFLLRAGIEF